MSDWVHAIPKAELHVHLEGTMNANVIAQLAERNQLANPAKYFDEQGHIIWRGFTQFIEMYDLLSAHIQSPEDLHQITYAYLAQCHEEGAIYVELTVSPDHAANAGMSYPQMLETVSDALNQARKDFGIESRLIMVLVRHEGEEACMAVLNQVVANPSELVVGIGLAGDERSHPARLFKQHYQKAKAHGLQLTAHAGEWGGPQQVWEALDVLDVSRIGHGVQSIDDPKLLDFLLEKDIHLEVCPMSNIALEVYPDYASHPIAEFLKRGINFSLNSDDPPFFSTTIGHEYEQAAKHLALDEIALKRITQNAIEKSFAPTALKSELLKKL